MKSSPAKNQRNRKLSHAKASDFEKKRMFTITPDFRLRPVYTTAVCLYGALVGVGFVLVFFRGMEPFFYACLLAIAVLTLGHAADCFINQSGGFWRKLSSIGAAGMGGFLLGSVAGLLQLPLLVVAYWITEGSSAVVLRDIVLIPFMGILIATFGLFAPFIVVSLLCGFVYNGWKLIFPRTGMEDSPPKNSRLLFYLSCCGLAFAGYVTSMAIALDYPPGEGPSRYSLAVLIRQVSSVFQDKIPANAGLVSSPAFIIARSCLYSLTFLAILGVLWLAVKAIDLKRQKS